jgi:RNA recognition motif-containing protein
MLGLKSLRRSDLKSIFVGNLDFGVTEDQIRALFEAHGAVDRVTIMTDRDTGRSRGFAFVEMANSQEADQAIAAVNGTNLSGRALNVNEARPKPVRRGGPGGGGPGGGGPPRQRREPRW